MEQGLASASGSSASLRWGLRYAMVRPEHFRIDYQINPYMNVAVQPDPARALQQWKTLLSTMESHGAGVEVIDQREDSPDMVYAMNLGLVVSSADESVATLSHMRYPERRRETETAQQWFAATGRATRYVGRSGVGAHFEAGDAFPFAGRLVTGYGPRTEELALKHLATELDVCVQGARITHPGMYHLDLAFCPLDENRALICPAAFDEASVRALLDVVPSPILITEEEALTMCANSIVIGRTVLMPACPSRVRAELEAAHFDIVIVDVSEFHKGGGSIRCLTNPLDIQRGRDLDQVSGGEVLLPASAL